MSYSFSADVKQEYLHVRVSGENSPENVRSYMRQIHASAAMALIPSVLIEEKLEGPPIDPVEVYKLIRDASAETSPIIQRIAYVDLNPRRSEQNIELAVTVARDLGVNVRSFPSVEAAREWLLGPKD
jgi:hypothetical protein